MLFPECMASTSYLTSINFSLFICKVEVKMISKVILKKMEKNAYKILRTGVGMRSVYIFS